MTFLDDDMEREWRAYTDRRALTALPGVLTDSAPAPTRRGAGRHGAGEREGMTEARAWRWKSAGRRAEPSGAGMLRVATVFCNWPYRLRSHAEFRTSPATTAAPANRLSNESAGRRNATRCATLRICLLWHECVYTCIHTCARPSRAN